LTVILKRGQKLCGNLITDMSFSLKKLHESGILAFWAV